MITAYHRPASLEEAQALLAQPNARPLGGGTVLSRWRGEPIVVVDLQSLGWNRIEQRGNELDVGATVTLQQLLESEFCPDALKKALYLEAPLNLRHAATVAGTLVSSDGKSPFVTALLALDVKLILADQQETVLPIGEFLPFRPRVLIRRIVLPLQAHFAFEYVARTPSDIPLLCVAMARWKTGRTRVAVGGWGPAPALAMDGPESHGYEAAVRNACYDSSDYRASADYRKEVAGILARRCLTALDIVP